MFLCKNQLKNLILLLLFFILTMSMQSCADQLFPEFTVEDAYIQNDKVLVRFSADVYPTSCKKNFLFAEDENEIQGAIDFDGNIMLFTPKEKISQNHCYKIIVFSGAQDISGNTLQHDFQKIIYTKNDLTEPEIIDIKYKENLNNISESIELKFNKEINEQSFLEAFSLEPAAEAFFVWAQDMKNISINFKSPLLERQQYSIKIEKSLKDIFNNTMANDFYWSWTNKAEAKNPTYKIYATKFGKKDKEEVGDYFDNIDYSKEIEIIFDKNVLGSTLNQGIQVEPQTTFTVEPILEANMNVCKKAKIIFNEKIKWDTQKILIIKNAIKDINSFPVAERKIKLINNSPSERPPKFEHLLINVNEKDYILDSKNNFQTIDFPIEKYPCGSFTNLPIYFIFSISKEAASIDKISAYEGISVSSSYAGTIDLNKIEILTESEILNDKKLLENIDLKEKIFSIINSGKKICVIKYSALFKNAENNEKTNIGLIEFLANEKICDNNKVFMEEEIQFTCNKI